MNELANGIGWIVIVVGSLYALVKIAESFQEPKRLEQEKNVNTWNEVRRIAYRKIYRATSDERIRNQVKWQYVSWAELELELNDKEYELKMQSGHSADTYFRALAEIEKNGLPFRLENGEIVTDPRLLPKEPRKSGDGVH